MRVLITAGGTSEPIDGVRYITNFSTGKTGASIADEFSVSQHDVVYLHARSAELPKSFNVIRKSFFTYQDLKSLLEKELKNHSYDLVIHAAAVSDYSIAGLRIGQETTAPRSDKISSDGGFSIDLVPTPKLLDQIKSLSKNPNVKVVGFKLTNTSSPEERALAIQRATSNSNIDALVYNDLGDISENSHGGEIHYANQTFGFQSKKELARRLVGLAEDFI